MNVLSVNDDLAEDSSSAMVLSFSCSINPKFQVAFDQQHEKTGLFRRLKICDFFFDEFRKIKGLEAVVFIVPNVASVLVVD